MLLNVEFWSKEKYLPTKRCRKLREHYVKNRVDVDIKELTEKEFPIAFIVHKNKSVYENAKSYDDFDGNGEYKMFAEEIRAYKGKLFRPARITHGAAISTNFESFDYIKQILQDYASGPCWEDEDDFTENSIVKENDREEREKTIFSKAEKFVICDGKVWNLCEEPMYRIMTFGLGHNHGGTGFFINYCNPKFINENYFNALEREKAIAYGKQVALNRGDTHSAEGMGEHDIIEVLMPEMVTRNPQEDHREEDYSTKQAAKKKEDELFIDNWLNEHFGILNQKEAKQKSIFIVFDKNGNFVKTVTTGYGEEFHYVSPAEDNCTMEYWLRKNKLYAHKASSFCGRNRSWYNLSLKEQLENLCWEFDESGKVRKTQW